MNFAGIGALHSLVSQVVSRRSPEDGATDAFTVPVNAPGTVPAIESVTQKNSGQSSGFDEAFAKTLFNLKTAAQPVEGQASFMAAANDSNLAASDSAVLSQSAVESEFSSAQQQFSDYQNQTPDERMREQLTGVSKEQYEALSPEEKLDVDTRLQAALKQQQQDSTADVNGKILAARLALV